MKDWGPVARRIRVPLSFGFVVFYLWLARPRLPFLVAGFALIAIGLAIRALASGHVVKDRELTATGPYAYTRHPLYLGSILMAAGFALAARSIWIVLAMASFFLLIYIPVIRLEEHYLLRTYRERYEEYARQVPVIVPRLRAFKPGGAFSRERYMGNREYNALLGTVLLFAALILKMIWMT